MEKEKAKANQEASWQSLTSWVHPAGRPIWPTKNYHPYDQAYWGQGKGKKGKKGTSTFQYLSLETNVIQKEKADRIKARPKRSQPSQSTDSGELRGDSINESWCRKNTESAPKRNDTPTT